MDTGFVVQRDDALLFTATGDIFWRASNIKTGPDGRDGLPGWKVGEGGLQAKVGISGKPFDVGARTSLFPDRHARPPHHPYPPPPIRSRESGALYIGFKQFRSGVNTGAYEVAISRAVPIT